MSVSGFLYFVLHMYGLFCAFMGIYLAEASKFHPSHEWGLLSWTSCKLTVHPMAFP